MTIFFTSDQHYGHKNVIKLCNRPFDDLTHMREMLIYNQNQIVGPDDTVIHMGDFSFLNATETAAIVARLNGHQIIVRGNHDRKRASLENCGFEVWTSSYMEWVAPFPYLQTPFWLSHYPKGIFDHPDSEPRFLDRRPPDDDRWLMCGHVHNAWKANWLKKMINVGVDAWNYRPIHLSEIICIVEGGPPNE